MNIVLAAALAAGSPANPTAVEPPVGQTSTPAIPAAAAEATQSHVVAALTPVSIEILTPLGSKTSKSGDVFPIRLAAPIIVDGVELVPAGASGEGEIVHAKKSGGMGAAGELVVAARFLEIGGRRLRLRSLKLVGHGKSNVDTVNAINLASAASPIPIGLFGFFISGGQVNVAQGTVAEAKTAEAFAVEAPAAAAVAEMSTSAQQGESTQ